MKKKDLRFWILVSITILYGFGVGYFLRIQMENYIDLITYALTIVAIIVAVIAFVKVKTNRYVYISEKNETCCSDILLQLKKKYKSRIIVTAHECMDAGDLKSDMMRHMIEMCSFCIVLIDGELSPFQKKEIKEMKKQHKRIIPILLSKESELPTILTDIVPLKLTDL